MNISLASLFADIPQQLPEELCQTLLDNPNIRIERILSKGHRSPEEGWYDQEQNEWVMLLQGQARLCFADQEPLDMTAGDYLFLPAHCKHRVDSTTCDPVCIWLAIHLFTTSADGDQPAGA
ncbi:MAG: cupin domain-containing protein [Gammaproteobacteria bacterium]